MGLTIRYKLRNSVDVYDSADGVTLVSSTSNMVLSLDSGIAPIAEALQSNWLTEDEAAGKAADLNCGYYSLIMMAEAEALNGRIEKGDDTLFSLSPSPPDSAFKGAVAPEETYLLNRFAYLRRGEGCLLLESPLTPCRISIHDRKLTGIVHSLCSGLRLDIAGDEVKAFLSALIALGFVEPAETTDENSPLEFWEFHDLLYSARTLCGRNAYASGGTHHFHGKRPPIPAVRPPISENAIDLPEPSGETADLLSRPFGSVLSERRSVREFADVPLPLEELGAFLHVSARVARIIEDPEHDDTVSLRPSPSGGARHALEIYPFIRQCQGVEPGAYRYDPVRHRLERVPMAETSLERLLDENPYDFLGGGPPQVTLNISARIGRTAWKYEAIAYKLINQDMGCLYQTFYLVGTALGLAPCAQGSVDSKRLGEAHGIDWREEPFIGAFTLGK